MSERDIVERLRAGTMDFAWADLPDNAEIPAVPLLREAADEIERLREAAKGQLVVVNEAKKAIEEAEVLRDKIDGLESDLRSAVDVLFRRGDDEAREWCRLNYPTWYPRARSLTADKESSDED